MWISHEELEFWGYQIAKEFWW